MILKGNIRAGSQDLARHLMNAAENERVELAELRGFVADELEPALMETEAIASATNCTKFLYSLSINPGEPISRDQYAHAIDKIERGLGLDDQPRAVVFHTKDGRDHCHVAWSRIDTEKMQAIHNAFDRQRLREIAKELGREFGHTLPEGLAKDRGPDRHKERFYQVSQAETAQAERSGITPQDRRLAITAAYRQADGAAAFRSSLASAGYVLAQGDRRGVVVVDRAGEVHSLARQIEGEKAKDIRATLKLDRLTDLPSVQQAKEAQAARLRQNARRSPPDTFNARQRVSGAEQRLTALTDAQRAELKAINGTYRDQLDTIREMTADRLTSAEQQVKAAYRDEWARLYARQREEKSALQDAVRNPVTRLKALLANRHYDFRVEGNRGNVAKAFNFIIRGKADMGRVDRQHASERRNLGDMQRLALREERREIKAEASQQRASARDERDQTTKTVTKAHDSERETAEKRLHVARQAALISGVDCGRDDPQQSRKSFADSVRELTGEAEYQKAEREAREQMERERQQERERGDDGRTMEP